MCGPALPRSSGPAAPGSPARRPRLRISAACRLALPLTKHTNEGGRSHDTLPTNSCSLSTGLLDHPNTGPEPSFQRLPKNRTEDVLPRSQRGAVCGHLPCARHRPDAGPGSAILRSTLPGTQPVATKCSHVTELLQAAKPQPRPAGLKGSGPHCRGPGGRAAQVPPALGSRRGPFSTKVMQVAST